MSKLSALSILLRGAATAALITAIGAFTTSCGGGGGGRGGVDDGSGGGPQGVISVIANDGAASENGDTGQFTVFLVHDTPTDLEVAITLSGTATLNADYNASHTTSVTIPKGLNGAVVSIEPFADLLSEGEETVTLEFIPPAGYVVGNGTSASIVIQDVEITGPVISVSASDAAADESGDVGEFTIQLSQETPVELELTIALSGSAVIGDDYTASNSDTVIMPAGSDSATITVLPLVDGETEGDEFITLELTVPEGYTAVGGTTAVVTITDVVSLVPIISVTATDASADESGDVGEFTIQLSQETPVELELTIALGGSAAIDADYSATSTDTITIPAGSDSATIAMTPVFDGVTEGDESVTLEVTVPEGYQVGGADATVNILDVVPTISVAATPEAVVEGQGTLQFTIELSHTAPANLDVTFELTGTATPGTDYTADLTTSATISEGTKTAVVTITPLADTENEDLETVSIDLELPENYQAGNSLTATVEIESLPQDIEIVDLGMTLKAISRGTFTMGSPGAEPHRTALEGPQCPVTISQNFWMSTTETTIGQYQTFLNTASTAGSPATEEDPSPAETGVVAAESVGEPADGVVFGQDWSPLQNTAGYPRANPVFNLWARNLDQPMVGIKRGGGLRFCAWLTDRERERIPAGYEYRLPTEAEWEYCCRAGSTTVFQYGNDEPQRGDGSGDGLGDEDGDYYRDLGDHDWYQGNYNILFTTRRVGLLPANSWGLHDMHGNVSEFCHDLAWPYPWPAPARPLIDPTGSEINSGEYMLRGGSFLMPGKYCRSAYRIYEGWAYQDGFTGFRVVLAPIIAPPEPRD